MLASLKTSIFDIPLFLKLINAAARNLPIGFSTIIQEDTLMFGISRAKREVDERRWLGGRATEEIIVYAE